MATLFLSGDDMGNTQPSKIRLHFTIQISLAFTNIYLLHLKVRNQVD